MEKEFIPYKEAVSLKELGFDGPCFGYYHEDKSLTYTGMVSQNTNSFWKINNKVITAPTFSQAFRWFRKNHGLYSSILPKKSYPDNYVSGVEWYVTICGGDGVEIGPDGTYTYEEAELACLNKLIEIIKQPKQ